MFERTYVFRRGNLFFVDKLRKKVCIFFSVYCQALKKKLVLLIETYLITYFKEYDI